MSNSLNSLFDKAGNVIEVIDGHQTGSLILLLIILALCFAKRGPPAP